MIVSPWYNVLWPDKDQGSEDPGQSSDQGLTDFWQGVKDYLGGLFESSGEAADKQRVYNAEEAQKEREWQEMMRSTYWQDMVSGMEAAGLNPRVVFGGGSAPTMPTPSGASASSGIPQTDTAASMINAIASMIDAIVGAVNPTRKVTSVITRKRG